MVEKLMNVIRLFDEFKKASSVFFKMVGTYLTVFLSFDLTAQETGFTAQVNIEASHINNMFRTSNEVSDNALTVVPMVTHQSVLGKQILKTKYKGKYALYQNNGDADYADHSLLFNMSLNHRHKVRSEFSIGYQEQIEQPGSTNALTLDLDKFTQIKNKAFLAKFFVGNLQSKGQIVGQYVSNKVQHVNNLQSFRDYNKNTITGTFYYRATPKTRALFEVSLANLAYQNSQNFDLSNDQKIYFTGIEWNVTAMTSSIFKVGYQKAEYNDEQLFDLSGLSYYLDIFWRPNTYTFFKIGASRAVRESAEQSSGGYISDDFNVSITHDFRRNVNLSLGYGYIKYDFNNSQNRNDNLQNLSIKLGYKIRRWLQLFTEYKSTKRASNYIIYQYDANNISLGIKALFN